MKKEEHKEKIDDFFNYDTDTKKKEPDQEKDATNDIFGFSNQEETAKEEVDDPLGLNSKRSEDAEKEVEEKEPDIEEKRQDSEEKRQDSEEKRQDSEEKSEIKEEDSSFEDPFGLNVKQSEDTEKVSKVEEKEQDEHQTEDKDTIPAVAPEAQPADGLFEGLGEDKETQKVADDDLFGSAKAETDDLFGISEVAKAVSDPPPKKEKDNFDDFLLTLSSPNSEKQEKPDLKSEDSISITTEKKDKEVDPLIGLTFEDNKPTNDEADLFAT